MALEPPCHVYSNHLLQVQGRDFRDRALRVRIGFEPIRISDISLNGEGCDVVTSVQSNIEVSRPLNQMHNSVSRSGHVKKYCGPSGLVLNWMSVPIASSTIASRVTFECKTNLVLSF